MNDLNIYFQLMENIDINMKRHNLRVGIITKVYLEYLKFSTQIDEADKIVRAALLHDIGKVTIPLKLLNKPSSLTEEEWKIMKDHPLNGSILLFSEEEKIRNMVTQHHERVDGTGYPFGLKSAEIERGAKIISIVDSFDAMISKRVYNNPQQLSDVLKEILKCSGSQFDLEYSIKFVEMFNNLEFLKRVKNIIDNQNNDEFLNRQILDLKLSTEKRIKL